MPDELEERLRGHASAFDSLLSLIPAKLYYGEDVSDQWQRKKQTPEQKRAARIAKLDPENAKSAKDVMDERAAAARKRRRVEDSDGCDERPTETTAEEERRDPKGKRRKREQDRTDKQEGPSTSGPESHERRAEKRAAKREAKKARKLKEKQKAETKRLRKEAIPSNKPDFSIDEEVHLDAVEGDGPEMNGTFQIEAKDISTQDGQDSTPSSSPDLDSTLQSPHHHSVSSSISSIQPPLDPTSLLKDTPSDPRPLPSSAELNTLSPQQRLEARIRALRAERKADEPNRRQPRNRQELLEQRRRKEEERRAHKKELRLKAKEEEMRKQEEEVAKRFSPGGSGSLLGSPRSPLDPSANNFSFGRVAFGDGTHADPSLSSLLAPHRKHGASDTGTALRAAQNKTSRLSGLDSNKRQEIEEKDMWLNAKKKAHGEKVRDDTSLLKKALKRQDKSKKKSEKEWQGRIEGVAKSQESRQKKRTDNITKRKDEKGGGSKKGASKNGKGKKAKVKRPGFEGSFKAKHSSGTKR